MVPAIAITFPVYLGGPLQLHPHFVLESLAYTIAFRLALRRFKRDNIDGAQRSLVIVGGLAGALLGSKGLAIVQHWDEWRGVSMDLLFQGKTIVGALLGALAGVELTKKIIGVKQSTGDAFAYPLIVGTAIGRVGCFLTGLSDRTYGVATSLPWGVDFGDGISRHPTQLYEVGFMVGLLLFLRWRSTFAIRSGDLFRFYLICYLGFRVAIDFIKPDFHPWLGLSAIQVACLLGLVYYSRDIPHLWQLRQKEVSYES
jgi:phosphatidylglycerol---prolipoprotein diacylglyceryl transferase